MDNCCNGNYGDVNKVISELKYIGARRARDWPNTDTIVDQWRAINAATGITFHASIPQTSPANQRVSLNIIQSWATTYPKLIDVIEGSNEPDTEYPASRGATLADSALLQTEVYAVGKALGLPVAQLSVGGGWVAPYYEGNYKNFGKPPADYGNAHTYMNPTVPPATALLRITELAGYSVDGKPVDTTEFGTYQNANQTDETNSAFMHMAPFSSYLLGNVGLFVYALHDDMSNVVGFYKADGTKRAFADYWHHTTKLLSDVNGKNLPSKNISITFTNQKTAGSFPLGIKNVIMYKSDGSIWIASYDEEFFGAADGSQTIVFDKSYATVRVYDARNGTVIKELKNVSSIDLNLPINHVYLIELSADSSVIGATTTPTTAPITTTTTSSPVTTTTPTTTTSSGGGTTSTAGSTTTTNSSGTTSTTTSTTTNTGTTSTGSTRSTKSTGVASSISTKITRINIKKYRH